VSDIGALAMELAPFVILITGIAAPIIMVKSTPFCEKCGRWFVDWKKAHIPIESSNPLVETIFHNAAGEIKTLPMVDAGDYIKMQMRYCGNCDDGNFQIQTVVHWDQLMEKNKVHNKENWFTVMVPPETGRKLKAAITSGK
jgi:hypothetical protein